MLSRPRCKSQPRPVNNCRLDVSEPESQQPGDSAKAEHDQQQHQKQHPDAERPPWCFVVSSLRHLANPLEVFFGKLRSLARQVQTPACASLSLRKLYWDDLRKSPAGTSARGDTGPGTLHGKGVLVRHNSWIITRCLFCNACGPHDVANCCGDCFVSLPRPRNSCPCCGLPIPPTAHRCGRCVKNPPPLDGVLAPFLYEPPIDRLLNRLKHRRDPSALPLLTESVAVLAESGRSPLPDLLIPVPMHWTRYLARGFNQAELLAHSLSQRVGVTCNTRLIGRTRRTHRQQQLSIRERRRNLRGSFRSRSRLDGIRIALVDDVATSLSTLLELATTLRAAGAAEIQCWVAARTPPSRPMLPDVGRGCVNDPD